VSCEGWTLTQIGADRRVWRDAFQVLANQAAPPAAGSIQPRPGRHVIDTAKGRFST